jgi:aminopeptidase YwaD
MVRWIMPAGLPLMLELARRLKPGPALDRDIYVLATTAEESGLLGARAFVAAPPIPLDKFMSRHSISIMSRLHLRAARSALLSGAIARRSIPIIIEHLAKTSAHPRQSRVCREFPATAGWLGLLQEGVPTVLVSSAFASRECSGRSLRAIITGQSDIGLNRSSLAERSMICCCTKS